jgi:hypothetical protein
MLHHGELRAARLASNARLTPAEARFYKKHNLDMRTKKSPFLSRRATSFNRLRSAHFHRRGSRFQRDCIEGLAMTQFQCQWNKRVGHATAQGLRHHECKISRHFLQSEARWMALMSAPTTRFPFRLKRIVQYTEDVKKSDIGGAAAR